MTFCRKIKQLLDYIMHRCWIIWMKKEKITYLIWKKNRSFFTKIIPQLIHLQITAKLLELQYEILPYPPYLPDFAPLDYFFISQFEKKMTCEEKFYIKWWSYCWAYFKDFDKSYYTNGITPPLPPPPTPLMSGLSYIKETMLKNK